LFDATESRIQMWSHQWVIHIIEGRQMSQVKRLGALNKFKSGEQSILIATDVASRGLDIKGVDMVINYDVP